jgi:hypothetical protein
MATVPQQQLAELKKISVKLDQVIARLTTLASTVQPEEPPAVSVTEA